MEVVAAETAASAASVTAPRPAGKAGQFDFLTGQWAITHRRRIAGTTEWDQFDGTASCWSILDGSTSIEELRIPSRSFHGMGLRVLNRDTATWHDYWMNAASGQLQFPGVAGHFDNGEGLFIAEESDGATSSLVRGRWHAITDRSCCWEQATSNDGGLTWQVNWAMAWTRTA